MTRRRKADAVLAAAAFVVVVDLQDPISVAGAWTLKITALTVMC